MNISPFPHSLSISSLFSPSLSIFSKPGSHNLCNPAWLLVKQIPVYQIWENILRFKDDIILKKSIKGQFFPWSSHTCSMISKVDCLFSWLVVTMLKIPNLLNRDSNSKTSKCRPTTNSKSDPWQPKLAAYLSLACVHVTSVACTSPYLIKKKLELKKLPKQSELRAKGARCWRWQSGSSGKKVVTVLRFRAERQLLHIL